MGACFNCNANTLPQDIFCGDCGQRLPDDRSPKESHVAANKPQSARKAPSWARLFLSWSTLLLSFHSLFFLATIDIFNWVYFELQNLDIAHYVDPTHPIYLMIFSVQFVVTGVCLWILSLGLRKIFRAYNVYAKNIWIANAIFAVAAMGLLSLGVHRYINANAFINPFILFALPAVLGAACLALLQSKSRVLA